MQRNYIIMLYTFLVVLLALMAGIVILSYVCGPDDASNKDNIFGGGSEEDEVLFERLAALREFDQRPRGVTVNENTTVEEDVVPPPPPPPSDGEEEEEVVATQDDLISQWIKENLNSPVPDFEEEDEEGGGANDVLAISVSLADIRKRCVGDLGKPFLKACSADAMERILDNMGYAVADTFESKSDGKAGRKKKKCVIMLSSNNNYTV